MNLRIDGIFNFETFQFLQSQKISHFGVDNFPQSLNFIQGHETEKILAKLKSETVFFCMDYEKAPIIESLVSVWNTKFPHLKESGVVERQWDNKAFALNLKNPIALKLNSFEHKDQLLKIPNLKYVSISQSMLTAQKLSIDDMNQIKSWFTEYLPNVRFILKMNWDEDLNPKVRTIFSISTFDFHLGDGLMAAYRTLDFSIAQKVLEEIYKRLR